MGKGLDKTLEACYLNSESDWNSKEIEWKFHDDITKVLTQCYN